MVQKIKTFAMLLLMAATVVTFGACGEKEEENNAPDDAKQLENTHWSYSNEDDDVYVYVHFEEWKQVHVNKTYLVDGLMTQDLYDGHYTYSAGKPKYRASPPANTPPSTTTTRTSSWHRE